MKSHNGPINVLLVDRDEAVSSVLELTSQDGSEGDRCTPLSPSNSQAGASPTMPTSVSSGIVADHSPMLSSAGAMSSQDSEANDMEVAQTGWFIRLVCLRVQYPQHFCIAVGVRRRINGDKFVPIGENNFICVCMHV